MAKKTGFMRVIGRTDYVVVARMNRLPNPPYKEILTVLDFTFKR